MIKRAYAVLDLELTFAGVHAVEPAVGHVSVASASTSLVPGTAWSATTDSTRFLERGAVWTYLNRRGDVWCSERRGDWRASDSPPC